MTFFLDKGSHFLKCHVRYWTWDRICSGHPALYRQLAGLDSNPEPSSLWFAEAEISAQGSQLQAVASSPGSLRSPHLCCSNLPKIGESFIFRCWSSLPSEVYHLPSASQPQTLSSSLQFLPLCGCSPALSKRSYIHTYVFLCPYCVIITCGKFSAIDLLQQQQKLKLSRITLNFS